MHECIAQDEKGLVIAVTPQTLPMYWDFMRSQIECIHASSAQSDWIPEDIYADIRANQRVAFVIADSTDGRLIGHVVLARIQGRREAVLHIMTWMLSKPGYGDLLFNFARNLAVELGCSRITGAGRRPGLGRLYKKYGGEIREVVYDFHVNRPQEG